MIPMGIAFCALFIWAFFWATDSGQFEDLETPPHRMLSNTDLKETHKHHTEKT